MGITFILGNLVLYFDTYQYNWNIQKQKLTDMRDAFLLDHWVPWFGSRLTQMATITELYISFKSLLLYIPFY